METVDIVIPLYNKCRFIGRAIRSILRQTHKDWRLIIVDDGSTDDSAEIVKTFKDDRIELYHQKNQGPGAARNTGIGYGYSEFVAFLDADDEWYPWYLNNSLSSLISNEVSAVSTSFYVWPEARDMEASFNRRSMLGRHFISGNEDPIKVSSLLSCMQAWNTVLRRKTIQKYNGFYEKDHCVFAEEQTFFCRVLFGEPIMIIGPSAVIYHNEDSKWGTINHLHDLEPYLSDPQTVLAYCPPEKKTLMSNLLAFRALKRARHDLLLGNKKRATELVKKFSSVRGHTQEYNKFIREMSYWWLPYWARLRWISGPFIRVNKYRFMRRFKLLPTPPSTFRN